MSLSFYHLTLLLVFVTTVEYRFRFDIAGSPSFTLTEILSYSMVLLHAGRAGFNNSLWRKELTASFRGNRGIFLYFGWAAIASVAGLLTRSSYGLQMFKDLLPSLFIYFFIVTYVSDIQRMKMLLVSYLAGICVNLSLAASQIVFNGPRVVEMSEAANVKMDFSGIVANNIPTGLLSHPNGLAMLLLPVVILAFSALVYRLFPGRLSSLLLAVILIITTLVLYYTHSKGVYAWSLIGMMLLFVYSCFHRWRFFMGISVLLAGIVCITCYSVITATMSGSTLSTVVDRMIHLSLALDVIRTDHFVKFFGNAFDAMLRTSRALGGFEYENAHNAILNQIIFYGIPAFGFYLWFFFVAIRRLSLFPLMAEREMKTLGAFLFASLTAMLGEYFFEPANEGVLLQAQLFILIALATVLSANVNRQFRPGLFYAGREKRI